MGEYFMYVNLDREQWFGIGALGGDIRMSAVGRGLGARALGLLLTTRGGGGRHTWVGAWAGERVVCVGDYVAPNILGVPTTSAAFPGENLYSHARSHWTDVSGTLVLMLLAQDGPDDLVEAARRRSGVFVRLAELAIHHRRAEVERILEEHFGPEWRARYGRLRKEDRTAYPAPVS